MANLLLQYVKTGRIENQDDIKNEYTDVLYDCIQTLDFAIDERNPKERISAVNHLFVYCWQFISSIFDEINESEDEGENPNGDTSGKNPSNDSADSTENDTADEIMNQLDSELCESSEMVENMSAKSVEAEEIEISENEQERMKHEQTAIENMISEDDGLTIFNNDYISKVIDNELENIVNGFAEIKFLRQ